MRIPILAAFLVLLLAAPAAGSGGGHWLGVVADGPLTDPTADRTVEWDRLADSGASSVRTAFYWRDGQPDGPGGVDFARYDRVVLEAASRGLDILPVIQGTPAWAAATPGNAASPPRDAADLGRFVRALAVRYGPGGTLWRDRPELRSQAIRYWQVWNEPSLTSHWSRQPFARSYVRVLRSARRALRSVDDRARVVLAGLPNFSWTALRAIYRARGRKAFDVVALHPYTGRPRNVVRIVALARRVMRRYGDARKPVWVTELSWPAARGKTRGTTGFETDDRGQARRLREGVRLLRAARRRLGIGRVYWYTWLSAEGGPSSFGWSGLRRLRPDGRIVGTPALRVFREIAQQLAHPH